MRVFLICICILVMISGNISAQNVELNETRAIKEMTDVWVARNRSSATLEGWRVQIASSTDRFEVQSVKDKFVASYPGISCDWYHEKPYYKVKAGAFKHSWEARKLIALLRTEFPTVYPVFDKKIRPSDFISTQ